MPMDPVNKKALKKDFDDRKDKDLDNDGDTDSTDKYLHKRRQAVSKAIGKMKESVAVFESHFEVGQKVEYEAPDGGEYYGTIIKTDKPEESAYYHVKLENGKVVKAKPEQLEAEDEDDSEESNDIKEAQIDEVLKVSDGMGAWIDDFKKSDAPQFNGKDDKERREMAVAAYLAAKRKNK